jgi:ABC-type lipoprotein release transport system permease subunit
VLAALVVAYTVITGARRHRRDLAVLRAVGLERSGLRHALMWQGALLAGVILAIGLPLGLAVGVRVWRGVADGIGIDHAPSTPAWLFLPAAGIVLAALLATVWVSRLRRGALVNALRAE